MSKPLVELVSITYKVNGKQFTKKMTPAKKSPSSLKKPASRGLEMAPGRPLSLAAPHPEAADGGCGDGARCVNGILEILICFGNTCQWESTGQPCNC